MDKESFDRLVSAIEDAGYEARKYSGRGMYGRHCLGVECGSPISAVMQIISSACENADDVSEIAELCEAFSDPSTDNMGRDAIVYWSSIPWLEEEEGDDGDGEDAVEVCVVEYEDAHGKKPRGEGQWFFNTEDGKQYSFRGDFKHCRASAVARANEDGVTYLSVGS